MVSLSFVLKYIKTCQENNLKIKHIPYFENVKFVRVGSLVGRYFYSMYQYIVKMFEIVFSVYVKDTVKDTNIFPCLHFPIT